MQAGISYTAIIVNCDNVIKVACIVSTQKANRAARFLRGINRAAYRGGNTTVIWKLDNQYNDVTTSNNQVTS